MPLSFADFFGRYQIVAPLELINQQYLLRMQRKRLVYSSLDTKYHDTILTLQQNLPVSRPKSKIKKRKKKYLVNQQLAHAAKVYLQDNKLAAKEAHNLLKSAHPPKHTAHSQRFPHQKEKRYGTEEDLPDQAQSPKKYEHRPSTIRKKHVKAHQNSMLQSYKIRYNIRQSQGVESDRGRNVFSSTGNRSSQVKKQKIALDEYFLKLQELNKQRKLEKVEEGHLQTVNESMNNLAKLYLSHRQGQKSIKLKNHLNTGVIYDFMNEKKEIKPRQLSDESKISARSFKTIENKQRLMIRNIKGYVVNEKEELVSNILANQGWKAFGEQSERFTLKWTYNDSFKDYDLLRASNRAQRMMFFNHVSNNKLVNKDDFSQIAQALTLKGYETSGWIPETYIISTQRPRIAESYHIRTIFAGLDKHYRYFDLKECHAPQLSVSCTSLDQKIMDVVNFLTNLSDESVETQIVDSNQKENFVVNISLLYNLLVLSCNVWLGHSIEKSQKFCQKFNRLCSDSSVLSSLFTFNKVDLLFQQYHRFRSSDQKRNGLKQIKGKNMIIANGYLKTAKLFVTPSQQIINAVYLLHDFFSKKQDYNFEGGLRNLWIVKPCSGSKGCGIQIIDRIQKINQTTEPAANKMIQKYIQDIWTVRPQQIERFNVDGQYRKILNKKFDIRQWVLIIPPHSYIFSSFYIRICSKQYDFDSLGDPCSHLANFTINKDHYEKSQQSVMSEQEFETLLTNTNKKHKYPEIKAKIRERIKLLTDEAMLQCEIIPGTFQILGFDILLDQCLNPWIIQCNMSPACHMRTQWLKEMKTAMTAGALELVLGPTLFTAEETKSTFFQWVHLSKVKIHQEKQIKGREKHFNSISIPV